MSSSGNDSGNIIGGIVVVVFVIWLIAVIIEWFTEVFIPWITDTVFPFLINVFLFILGTALVIVFAYFTFKFFKWLHWMIYLKPTRTKRAILTLEQRKNDLLQHAREFGIYSITASSLPNFRQKVQFRAIHLSGLAETGHHEAFSGQDDVAAKKEMILSKAWLYFCTLSYIDTVKKSLKKIPRLEDIDLRQQITLPVEA